MSNTLVHLRLLALIVCLVLLLLLMGASIYFAKWFLKKKQRNAVKEPDTDDKELETLGK